MMGKGRVSAARMCGAAGHERLWMYLSAYIAFLDYRSRRIHMLFATGPPKGAAILPALPSIPKDSSTEWIR
ncbi:hypothetical protein BN1012_Phect1508 [Candidatus Phaeomarinobacter ectocarpi]|uniref:Uncharacterized protein n=1 Tax=Candidatus Phaeomarinibacter ectocarpi TaxID=1458461 RepID=X5MD05_9HYPH|nr:hypothetical protein BN1012_Phect1508 [Candidatus Phaeomarinobacter ectocarpi]